MEAAGADVMARTYASQCEGEIQRVGCISRKRASVALSHDTHHRGTQSIVATVWPNARADGKPGYTPARAAMLSLRGPRHTKGAEEEGGGMTERASDLNSTIKTSTSRAVMGGGGGTSRMSPPTIGGPHEQRTGKTNAP